MEFTGYIWYRCDTKLSVSYLSTLQWAINTADLDVAMFGPWDDLQSLKVAAQNHHITTWGIGLWRERWNQEKKDEDDTQRKLYGGLLEQHSIHVPKPVSPHQKKHHKTALTDKQMRLVFYYLFLWLSEGEGFTWAVSHYELCLLHRRRGSSEIDLLFFHPLNSMGLALHRVCLEIRVQKQWAVLPLYFRRAVRLLYKDWNNISCKKVPFHY